MQRSEYGERTSKVGETVVPLPGSFQIFFSFFLIGIGNVLFGSLLCNLSKNKLLAPLSLHFPEKHSFQETLALGQRYNGSFYLCPLACCTFAQVLNNQLSPGKSLYRKFKILETQKSPEINISGKLYTWEGVMTSSENRSWQIFLHCRQLHRTFVRHCWKNEGFHLLSQKIYGYITLFFLFNLSNVKCSVAFAPLSLHIKLHQNPGAYFSACHW